jgi:hypothetical protein
MKYKIFVALRDDINSGWVWVQDQDKQYKQRAVICIKNSATRKEVYCEICQVDPNFRKNYNTKGGGREKIDVVTPSLVINEWYRKLLGIDKNQPEHKLDMTEVDTWYGKIRACLHHPQVIVRVATKLGIISVVEGLIGFGLGLASLFVSLCK